LIIIGKNSIFVPMKQKFVETMENFKTKFKNVFNQVFWVLMVVLGVGAGFAVGYYYEVINPKDVKGVSTLINRNQITLAMDEYERLLIIDKTDGSIYRLLRFNR
jgi:hypothetical protein